MSADEHTSRISLDRFIPRRANTDIDLSYHYIRTSSGNNHQFTKSDRFINHAKDHYNLEQYRSELRKIMMPKENRILVFSSPKSKLSYNKDEYQNTNSWPVYPRAKPLLEPPLIILDMPDFDTNLTHQVVDWGKKGYIATIYEKEVHLWHPEENLLRHVTDTDRHVQSCIKWNTEGTQIAMGLDFSRVVIWNLDNLKTSSTVGACRCSNISCTITAMEFTKNNCLITGCSSGSLCAWMPDFCDIRTAIQAHKDDVISIKLSCNEYYIVTTGMDKTVKVWTWPTLQGRFKIIFSEAPVKAVAWHPWRNSLLAIGGPTCTFLCNIGTLKVIEIRDHPYKDSFLDCLTFNPLSAELVASYYCFTNDYDGVHLLTVMKDLDHVVDEGQFHDGRVPYLLWDATGTKLATASADENLCIWDFFGSSSTTKKKFLKLSQKKELSSDMLKNLNCFNVCIR